MKPMKLTARNYFIPKAERNYMSASQIKSFMTCEAATLATIRGEYERPITAALLVGSYVDAFFEGGLKKLQTFISHHPEIVKRDGTLKADYVKADEMIARATRDAAFMDYMDGLHQKILTGKICGVPFKCKLDVYRPGERIVDLKTVKDFEPQYLPEQGRVDFATAWRWPMQMAIYQRVVEQTEGKKLPCYIACITKQDPPDIGVFEVPQVIMDYEIEKLKDIIPYYDAIKKGITTPNRCEKCAYCRATHEITRPVGLDELNII